MSPGHFPSMRRVCRLGTRDHQASTDSLSTKTNFSLVLSENNIGHIFISQYIYKLLRGEGDLFVM